MSDNNENNEHNENNWEKYRIYVTECLTKLMEKTDELSRDLNDFKFYTMTEHSNNKKEMEKDLREISKALVELQVRQTYINFIASATISAIVAAISKFFFN